MSKRFISRSLLLCPILALAATAAAAAYPVTVVDDSGTTIRLAKRPARIVSLTPSNTEILFALGLDKEIVGVTTYCDYPAAAKAKEKVGDLNLDLEKVVSLRPDLLLGVGSMQSEAISRLRDLGLVVMVLDPTNLETTMAAIIKVGRVTGREGAARKLVNGMKKRIAAVKNRLSGLTPAQKPRVFVEIWMDPVMTAGPGTFTGELITLAGGRDIAHDAKPWAIFSPELIVARDPEIIVSQCGSASQILKRPGWEGIDAVRNGRVYDVDQNIFSRLGPRLVEALEILAKLLHPGKFN